MKRMILICLLQLLAAITANAQQTDFPKLAGPYLGQKPPGMAAEIFAPGIVSLESSPECCRAISPDGKEFLFVRALEGEAKIFRMTEGKNGWTRPELIKYSNKSLQYTPFISPDGKKFLFMDGQYESLKGKTDKLPEIKILTREGNDWGAPLLIFSLIGGDQPYYITMAKNGTLYFSYKGSEGIYRSEFIKGKYSLAERLPDEINYLEGVTHPYISPDESYLIVNARNSKVNNGLDLFISFRKKDSKWIKAVNMGAKINSMDNEMCPSVSSDGKYIFFGRASKGRKGDIYWVSAKIIEELRPKE